MKAFKLIAALALVVLAASVARADGIDPTVTIRQTDPTPILITDPNETFTFSFSVTTATIFDVGIENDTSFVLQSLSLALTGTDGSGNPLSFSFGTNPGDSIFADFSSSVNGNTTTLTFSGTDATHTGLLPSPSCFEDFCTPIIYDIEFAGIPPNSTITGAATVSPNATPEPATLVLFAAGLAGLAALKKRNLITQS